MPKHRAEKLLVGKRNDINVGRLVHYAAAMAENEKATGSAANKHIGENRNKTSASGAVIWRTFSSLGSRNGRKQSGYSL